MFFFSSRRRHTRCGRDWSSDVCSSDLEELVGALNEQKQLLKKKGFDWLFNRLSYNIDEILNRKALEREAAWESATKKEREIGRASCRGKSVELDGRSSMKEKKTKRKRA